MTEQLKFCCPGCEGILDIPGKYRGRKVKCPKCSTVFRAGKKQSATIADAPSQPFAAPPAQPFAAPPEQPIAAQLVSPEFDLTHQHDLQPEHLDGESPLSIQADPFGSMMTSSEPLANVAPSSLGVSRKEAIERGTQKQRHDRNEANETDERIQSAGLFLIFLPLIASVLPLFGFQLRRLASAGEFAPLGAMFLGLIGAGCIAYARRDRGDALPMGGAAAAFVLVTGVVGFILLLAMPSDGVSGPGPGSTDPFANRPSAPRIERPPNVPPVFAPPVRHVAPTFGGSSPGRSSPFGGSSAFGGSSPFGGSTMRRRTSPSPSRGRSVTPSPFQ